MSEQNWIAHIIRSSVLSLQNMQRVKVKVKLCSYIWDKEKYVMVEDTAKDFKSLGMAYPISQHFDSCFWGLGSIPGWIIWKKDLF